MNNEKSNLRNLLLRISVACDGDFDLMSENIVKKNDCSQEEICIKANDIKSSYVTVLDVNYPKELCSYFKPPILFYYKGNYSLLQALSKNVSVLNGKNTCDYATKSVINILRGVSSDINIVLPVSDMSYQVVTALEQSRIRVVLVSDKSLTSTYYTDTQKKLIDDVLANGGLIVTEVPDTSNAKSKKYYQMRLISYLSSTALVGGVSKRDSSIHAIALSLQNGKSVCCIPFEIGSAYVNNSLIRDGAFLIEEGSDLVIPNSACNSDEAQE